MPRSNLFKTALILTAATLAAGPALAQSANWTGGYVGIEIGGADAEIDVPGGTLEDVALSGGVLAGYDYDMGTWVIGGGADIDFTDVTVLGADIDRIWRLKARGGYKVGNALVYATGGYANVALGGAVSTDESGYYLGGGFEYQTRSNFSIGSEVLYHRFNKVASSPFDLEVVTYQVRGAFRF